MASNFLIGIAALAALVPASLLPYRREGGGGRDLLFWALLGAALAGPLALTLVNLTGEAWQAGLSVALWLSVAASLLLFLLLSLITREAWRLAPLLLPYLCLLGLIALVWSQAPHPGPAIDAPGGGWLAVHIGLTLAAYALATIAAVAGVAALVQERSLKAKRPATFLAALSRRLPALTDAEALQIRLLAAAELVLAAGILTGMALFYLELGTLFVLDHKTLLALLAFVAIGVLLLLHHGTGLRGRQGARLVLVAYLLLTLAYPGVKFVTDVLMT